MIVEFHTKLGNPQRIEVTRVVVYDRYDNPIVAAVEVEPGTIVASALEEGREQEFQSLLHGLGLHKTVMVQSIGQVPLPDVRFNA